VTTTSAPGILAPFPWFGGKRRAASLVWERFGDVPNYVEPFFGSGAVLLNRTTAPGIETVNDLDGYLANFWRAVQADPETTARWADWPVNENDLSARHLWLLGQRGALQARLSGDPDYFDAKIAGWWVWGLCSWIGSGWCSGEGPWRADETGALVDTRKLPHLSPGRGINRQLPHLGPGRGINRQLPHLGNAGQGILDQFQALSERLRGVRVASGDWSRVLGESVTTNHGMTGVFLDPPYGVGEAGYMEDSDTVSHEVRAWCLDNGANSLLRIAFCGYEGEGHDNLVERGWTVEAWKAHGGYGSQSASGENQNRHRERIWFSPACLNKQQMTLL
jgi:hypothetical protein